jgi:hypothetical protein
MNARGNQPIMIFSKAVCCLANMNYEAKRGLGA